MKDFRYTNTERIHYQQTYNARNFERCPTGRKEISPNGNLDLQKRMKRVTRNINYMGKQK